jgi:ribosomal protein S18 acetylase RimI-like enzyme
MLDAPAEARVTLNQQVGQYNDVAATLLEAEGYRYARRFWEMEIELGEEPAPPRWPDGVRIATLRVGQERSVFDAMQDAFAEHWGFVEYPFEDWRSWFVERETFDPSLWFLAWADDELAGASLCRARDDSVGWVNALGVRRPWRRLGLGLALLRHSLGEFRRRGLTRAGLDVDSENVTGATRLYERAGMRVSRYADAYQKVLREG